MVKLIFLFAWPIQIPGSMFLLLLLSLSIAQPVSFDVLAIKKCTPTLETARESGSWNVHGFWPEYSVSKWPQWCNKSRYDEFTQAAIASIQDQLNTNWYPCPDWHITEFKLLQHEWEKHGTCTDNTVLEYFSTALAAFRTAKSNDWYHCCDSAKHQCLIPFETGTTFWLGWCDTSGTNYLN